jgi:probable F420-dependent oxidoreductase
VVRLGVYLGGHLFTQRVNDFVELAKIAEAVGLDDVSLGEHVVLVGDDPKPPWAPRFVHRVTEPFPEPLTTLGVIAGATTHIRLVTGILIAPLRPPVLLAKQAATLHALSNGRLVLGVSTSWHAEEYAALQVPFEERGQRLDDTIAACKALWSPGPTTFESKSISLQHVWCEPKPDHPDDIPIWFTGKMRQQLVRRVAQWGHGWLPFIGLDTQLEPLGDDIAILKEAMRGAGRDPSTFEVGVRFRTMGRSLEQAFAEDLPVMEKTGITQTHVPLLSLVPSLDEAPAALERIARIREQVRV